MKRQKLTIELVPKSSWYINLRNELNVEDWDKLRKFCYKKAAYKCEICGGKGPKWPIECHEIWEYEKLSTKNKIFKQTLIGLIGLCPACHQVKHIGLSQIQGKYNKCLQHIMKVNKISRFDAKILVEYAFALYKARSLVEWDVDISKVYSLLQGI